MEEEKPFLQIDGIRLTDDFVAPNEIELNDLYADFLRKDFLMRIRSAK